VPFLVRWVFAVSSAVLLAGLVQYSVAQQQIVDRALQDSLRNYGALADELQTALAATSDPSVQEAAVAAELDHIGHSYGTAYVGLFAPDDRLIGESGKEAGRASPDPARLSARTNLNAFVHGLQALSDNDTLVLGSVVQDLEDI
jgi:hypothetical protein